MMHSLLFVVAEEQERRLVEERFGRTAPIIVTGVGAVNVFRTLSPIPRDTELVNVGFAGSADYAIGSEYEITECLLYHPNVTYQEPLFRLTPYTQERPTTICFTNNDFVLQSDYKRCVFDMELAFILAMGFEKVHSLKIVSDNLSLHEYRGECKATNQ